MRKNQYGPSKSIHYHTNPCSNRAINLRTSDNLDEVTCKTCIKAIKSPTVHKKSLRSDHTKASALLRQKKLKERKERDCLRCGGKFLSVSIANRSCPSCHLNKPWGVDLESHAVLL